MKLKLLLPVLLLMCFSCKTVFMPKQSTDAIAMIEKGQRLSENVFAGIEEGPDRTFKTFEEAYTAAIDAIDALAVIDNTRMPRPNYFERVILNQDARIKKALVEYREKHLTRGELSPAMAGVYKSVIISFWRPRMDSEKTLKAEQAKQSKKK